MNPRKNSRQSRNGGSSGFAIGVALAMSAFAVPSNAVPVESMLPTTGTDSCIGIRDTGEFMTCWISPPTVAVVAATPRPVPP